MSDTLSTRIAAVFAEVYATQTGRSDCPPLQPATVLLDTGLDSLGFAVLVIRLEEELGYDPFIAAAEAYYPRTFAEFVDFYAAHEPA